jgi:hypothetical protein
MIKRILMICELGYRHGTVLNAAKGIIATVKDFLHGMGFRTSVSSFD